MHARLPLLWDDYQYRSMNRSSDCWSGERGLHQSHGAGYADAVNHRHFPTLVALGIQETRHDHHTSGDESKNHNKVQTVSQRTGKAFERPRAVGKSDLGDAETGKEQDKHNASQRAPNTFCLE